MKSLRWVITYVIVASVGLWFAFFMSLRFVSPAFSQTPPTPPQSQAPNAPTAGDLPPEFMEEGAIPPPPPGAPVQPPSAPAQPAAGNDQGSVPVAPINPEFAGDDQYVYEPNGRRDPFKPYMNYRVTPGVGGVVNRADLTDPLQRWDLGRFTVMAIIWEVKNPKAMIKDPDGVTYMLSKNTKIGRNSGYVVAIREGEVVVVETVDTEGVVTKEVRILELKK